MQEATSKEKILKKIRKSLIHKKPDPYPGLETDGLIYLLPDESLEVLFAQKLIDAGGHFIFCENEFDFVENCIALANLHGWKSVLCIDEKIQQLFDQCEFPYSKNAGSFQSHQAGVTSCEHLIARTGSVLVSSKNSGRLTGVFSQVHIIHAYASQLVYDLKDSLSRIKEVYKDRLPSAVSVITGPSATADIENKLVRGAHGSTDVYVLLIDDVSKPHTH